MAMQTGSPSSRPPAVPSAAGSGGNTTIINGDETVPLRASWEGMQIVHAPEGYDDSTTYVAPAFREQAL